MRAITGRRECGFKLAIALLAAFGLTFLLPFTVFRETLSSSIHSLSWTSALLEERPSTVPSENEFTEPLVILVIPADPENSPDVRSSDPMKHLCKATGQRIRHLQNDTALQKAASMTPRQGAGLSAKSNDTSLHKANRFTVVMNTYKRNEDLAQTFKHVIAKVPFVDRVLIYWNDLADHPSKYEWPRIHVPIFFLNASRNSMNNRFLPSKLIRTDAVFVLDDDLVAGWQDMLLAYATWLDNRDAIVGPSDRMGYVRDNGAGVYDTTRSGKYNLVLTNAAFLHRKFLHAYNDQMPQAIRNIVDSTMNCDDIAMNFLVSNLTGRSPVMTLKMNDPPTPSRNRGAPCKDEGLCSRASHYRDRSTCIANFSRIYGRNPLKISSFVAKPKCE